MNTVFVTGGSGFVGRNLIRELVRKGYSVRALARSDKSAKIVEDLGARAVRGDMLDKRALSTGMKNAKYLFHLAADTSHGRATRQQEITNLEGTKTVYTAACEAGVKRAVHLSSEAVLLTGKPLVNADETRALPKKFAGGYSKTKALAEQIALGVNGHGIEVVVVRPRFIWGRDDTTALPQLIEAAKSGKLAWIDGGQYLVSTTHIDNAVEGMILAMEKGRAGEIYFITDGEPVIFRDFITRLLQTQNIKTPTKTVPRWLVVPVVKFGDFFSKITRNVLHGPMSFQEYATLGNEVTLDISKAKRELGYAPLTSLEDGLKELKTLNF